MSTVYGGIREERAIVGDRKGSRYVLGVTVGWRVNGRAKGVNREAHEVEVTVFAGHTIMEVAVNYGVSCAARDTRRKATWVPARTRVSAGHRHRAKAQSRVSRRARDTCTLSHGTKFGRGRVTETGAVTGVSRLSLRAGCLARCCGSRVNN